MHSWIALRLELRSIPEKGHIRPFFRKWQKRIPRILMYQCPEFQLNWSIFGAKRPSFVRLIVSQVYFIFSPLGTVAATRRWGDSAQGAGRQVMGTDISKDPSLQMHRTDSTNQCNIIGLQWLSTRFTGDTWNSVTINNSIFNGLLWVLIFRFFRVFCCLFY